MRRSGGRHAVEGLFAFALIGVFALLSLLLVLIGTRAYRSVVARAEANSQARCAVNYVLNKAHSADEGGAISADGDALRLPVAFDGEPYEICVYLYDGSLMEQLIAKGEALQREYGERLVEATAFSAERQGDLLRVEITTACGDVCSASVAVRSEG